MDSIIPLLVAFCGAMFGAYFAVLKNQKERLWTDRYEALLKIIEIAENIRSRFLVVQSNEFSIDNYSVQEKDYIEGFWNSSRFELARNTSKLKMLFREKEVKMLANALQDLDRAIIDAHASTGHDRNHTMNVVWSHASACIDEAIQLSRKKCL